MKVKLTNKADSSVIEFNFEFDISEIIDEVMVVPQGDYGVVTYLYHAPVCPWDSSYVLRVFTFEAKNEVSLSPGDQATIDLLFREITGIPFFVKLVLPPGNYTDGKKYLTNKSTVTDAARYAHYRSDTLMFWIYTGNVESNIGHLTTEDDNETVEMSFYYDFTMVDIMGDWTITVLGANIQLGNISFEFQFDLFFDRIEWNQNSMWVWFNKINEITPDTFTIKGSDSVNVAGDRLSNIGFFNCWPIFGKPFVAVDSTYRINIVAHDKYDKVCDTSFLWTTPTGFY